MGSWAPIFEGFAEGVPGDQLRTPLPSLASGGVMDDVMLGCPTTLQSSRQRRWGCQVIVINPHPPNSETSGAWPLMANEC